MFSAFNWQQMTSAFIVLFAVIDIIGSIPVSYTHLDMQEKIIILDFGSQTTQLIGRRVRELNVYCEIVPYNKFPHGDESVKGVILSGSPFSVYDASAFKVNLDEIRGRYPILGICYGAQFISCLLYTSRCV